MVCRRIGARIGLTFVACLVLIASCGGRDADLTGAWIVTFEEGEEFQLNLFHNDDSVTGFVTAYGDKFRISTGHYDRSKLTFSYSIEGEGEVDWAFTLQDENSMEGIVTTWERGHEGEQFNVSARRIE